MYKISSIQSQNSIKKRDSNLELYRIITMMLIIAHHYVVNSGLTSVDGVLYTNPTSWRTLFLLTIGAFGKTGINCFLMITGYFMCKSQITCRKFLKLFAEVVFYDILFNTIFWATGYAPFTLVSFAKNILPFTSITQNFTGCYLVFFLFIPFVNKLIQSLTQKQHLYLILLCSFTYILMGTIPFFNVSMNYVSWYIVIFFIASYIRLYPAKIFNNTKVWGILSVISVSLLVLSVFSCVWLGAKLNRFMPYVFAQDSNTFLAVSTAVTTFLFFKNIKIPYNKIINLFAGSTFGVLLIHAASDNMRKWLWKDVLNNVGMYDSIYMPLHAIGSVIGIFVVCAILDMLRIKFIETPFFCLWDKHYEKIKNKFLKFESKILSKICTSSKSDI